jgi:hypothetical protein
MEVWAGNMGYIYSSSGDFLVQGSTCEFYLLMNTNRRCLRVAAPPVTSWTISLETWFSNCGEDSLQHRVLLCISYHFYCSDLVHLRAYWEVLELSQLCNHRTRLQTPSGGKRRRKWYNRIENTSLFPLRCFYLCHSGISTGKLKIYTINGSKYSAKSECNMMIITPTRHKHPSRGANRPSDVAVTVNMNAEFNLSLIWWQLIP